MSKNLNEELLALRSEVEGLRNKRLIEQTRFIHINNKIVGSNKKKEQKTEKPTSFEELKYLLIVKQIPFDQIETV